MELPYFISQNGKTRKERNGKQKKRKKEKKREKSGKRKETARETTSEAVRKKGIEERRTGECFAFPGHFRG